MNPRANKRKAGRIEQWGLGCCPGGRPEQAARGAGQAAIELTFSLIIVVVLIIGTVRFFFWAARDLSARREAHEAVLKDTGRGRPGDVANAIRPKFFEYSPPDSLVRFGPQN